MSLPDPEATPCLSADEAFAQLGIDRTTGYRAIRDGTFPVPVIRVGRLIRVPTLALRRLLAVEEPDNNSSTQYPEGTASSAQDDEHELVDLSESARPQRTRRDRTAVQRQRRGSRA